MRLLVSHPDASALGAWCRALRAALPAATVAPWDAHAAAADYAVGWAVPTALFAAQPSLKGFFCAGAGVDDLLASPAVPTSLPLYRVEDAGMGEQMADYCSAAVLGWFTQREAYARQQAARLWRELPPQSRASWRIGLYGAGALGTVVGARFAALGFPVQCCSRRALASGSVDFDRFLGASRVLILLAPLTPETRGRFGARELALLPPGACVINVARGGLLVEAALLAALDAGHVAAAALDVFASEPLPPEHPFWRHPRVQVTPHAAAYTLIEPAAAQIAAAIGTLEAGTPASALSCRVDRGRGY